MPAADVAQKINNMHDTVADAEKKVRTAQERAAAAHALGVKEGSDIVNALANKYLDVEQKKREEIKKNLKLKEKGKLRKRQGKSDQKACHKD